MVGRKRGALACGCAGDLEQKPEGRPRSSGSRRCPFRQNTVCDETRTQPQPIHWLAVLVGGSSLVARVAVADVVVGQEVTLKLPVRNGIAYVLSCDDGVSVVEADPDARGDELGVEVLHGREGLRGCQRAGAGLRAGPGAVATS